jgi:hypothetical protein
VLARRPGDVGRGGLGSHAGGLGEAKGSAPFRKRMRPLVPSIGPACPLYIGTRPDRGDERSACFRLSHPLLPSIGSAVGTRERRRAERRWKVLDAHGASRLAVAARTLRPGGSTDAMGPDRGPEEGTRGATRGGLARRREETGAGGALGPDFALGCVTRPDRGDVRGGEGTFSTPIKVGGGDGSHGKRHRGQEGRGGDLRRPRRDWGERSNEPRERGLAGWRREVFDAREVHRVAAASRTALLGADALRRRPRSNDAGVLTSSH